MNSAAGERLPPSRKDQLVKINTFPSPEAAMRAVAAVTDAAVVEPVGGILAAFDDDAALEALRAEAVAVEALRSGIAMVEYHGEAFAVAQP